MDLIFIASCVLYSIQKNFEWTKVTIFFPAFSSRSCIVWSFNLVSNLLQLNVCVWSEVRIYIYFCSYWYPVIEVLLLKRLSFSHWIEITLKLKYLHIIFPTSLKFFCNLITIIQITGSYGVSLHSVSDYVIYIFIALFSSSFLHVFILWASPNTLNLNLELYTPCLVMLLILYHVN